MHLCRLLNRTTLAAITGGTVLSACVTINIYFPAAAAERAADRIIDEVWQLNPDAAKAPAGKSPSGGTTAK